MTPPRDQAARAAIREETNRTMFVVAGAGSGKTSALVERIATLVLRDGVRLGNIAAVTFTEKAGAELRDRLRARFEKAIRERHATSAAEHALEELDMAAIGTLHSFAARILSLHAIEAGLPPQITPADEIGSGIRGEQEWARVLVRMLEDDEVRPALQRVLVSTKADHLSELYARLSADWDLIDEKILRHPQRGVRVPDLAPLLVVVAQLRAIQDACTEPDPLRGHLQKALDWADRLDPERDFDTYETLQRAHGLWNPVSDTTGEYKRVGSATNWLLLPGGIEDAKVAYDNVRERAISMAREAATIALESLTRWVAVQVLESADERRRNGELTFQDLLVLARQVLRQRADVAGALHERYTHLLLDEFQDTDPIQIELAVRIAGGAAGAQHTNWRDIDTPPGALFVVGDPKQSIYRFRRADIGLYLDVQEWFRTTFGNESIVELDTNFRSVPGVLDWVNHGFSRLIQHIEHQQPPYLALHSDREALDDSVAVTHLGWEQHEMKHQGNSRTLRDLEAADVAAVVSRATKEGWPVRVPDPGTNGSIVRPIRRSDIAVLVPARTSLPMLREAFDRAGVPFRAEASSLLYGTEDVAEVMLAAQAVADRSDGFALVMTLRSSLFGLGDDDLWRWKLAGGSFSLSALSRTTEHGQLRELPVFAAMTYLRQLSFDAPRLAPADLLDRIIRDRRVLEVAADTDDLSEAADRWRRMRFVVDQARAWSETAHGGIRAYLEWARRQLSETAQVYESVLPETDVDAVRVLTIHAAKGLEFPMVVLSGMTALPGKRPSSIKFLWTQDGFAVSAGKELQTINFSIEEPIDEQMGSEEKKRLLYVGATRARDHLVVSMHHAEASSATPAMLLREVATDDPSIASGFQTVPVDEQVTVSSRDAWPPAESREALLERLSAARRRSAQPASQSASGLEGSEPDVVLAVEGEDETRAGAAIPLAKDQRDLDTPSYNKGREATAIGTAVHAVLQTIDLKSGEGLDTLAEMQCLAEGIPHHVDYVKRLVGNALASDVVHAGAAGEYWRESLLAMTDDDDQIIEGYADLIYRDSHGVLHVIDYKTDVIRSQGDLERRTTFYGPQLAAYAAMLRAATGQQVDAQPLFLDVQSA